MRSNHRFLLVLLLVLSFTAPAGAQLKSIPWRDLPQRVAGRLIPPGQLKAADCPKDLASRAPSRRVLQYIENTFYSWEEYDLNKAPGSSFCIVLRRPHEQALSAAEAQILLTASGLWTDEVEMTGEAEVLDPDDPRLLGEPDEWTASPEMQEKLPRPAPGESLDRGIVGWAATGKASGPREGEVRVIPGASTSRGLTGKSVIGSDDRQRVTSTGSFPFNVISRLSYQKTVGARRATGFLVSPYMVLTNGHVVWDADGGRFSQNMDITPAQTGTARRAVRFATNAGWVETGRIEYDYSAAFVDNPFPGISTFMPLVFDVTSGSGGIVNVAGYPCEVRSQSTADLWHDDDLIDSIQGRVLRYKVDTSGCNSGSPVWETFSATGQRRAIAVHSSGDPLGVANSGARLVSQNFELLSEWLAWTPQTSRGLRLTINQVDPEDCPAVRAVVSVTNDAGTPVTDLIPQNFTLRENGVQQSIRVSQAEVSDTPIAVTLVLDASGSLSSIDVENIKIAARAFIDLLGPRDKVAVFHFANGVALAQNFTNDRGLARNAVNALNNQGGVVGDGNQTALYDAIVEAAAHSTTAVGRRALLVMTDGQNNTGSNSLQSAANAAIAAGVPAFTIGFGGASESVLEEIASRTGGRFFFGASSADLQAILRAIGRTLDNQYILSWLSNFASGGTQNIEVRVAEGQAQDQKSTTYSQAGTACIRPNSCSVRVLSPNGSEVWNKGTRQTIRWQATGPACGTIGVGIFNGSQIWPLADNTPNDGAQPFSLDFLPLSAGYQVRVVDRATGAYDNSDGTFSLRPPLTTAGFKCNVGPEVQCLVKGRFQVRVLWQTPDGLGGFAKAVRLTESSAYFWFFDTANAELVVKILDGRIVNSHIWVFSGGMTSLDYSIFVTDSTNGETRVYTNQSGDFASFGDALAFGPPPEDGPLEEGGGVVAEEADLAAFPQLAGLSPIAQLPVPGDLPFAAGSKATLWNQNDRPNAQIISSENRLDAGADAFDTEAADDFVVPAGRIWSLDGVDVRGAYFGNGPHGPAASVNVTVYADQGGLPGAALCAYSRVRPRRGLDTGAFEIDLPSPCVVGPGRAWLSVQANMSFPQAGQWGWQERSQQRERPSVWRNPGAGYTNACRNWDTRTRCGVADDLDFLFQLRGTTATAAACKPGANILCLNNKRFKVELTFRNTNGRVTPAKAVGMTPNTGFFWFFNATNPEVAVKVLDGRPANGHFWVFYGGMTNIEYTLRVTDSLTGRVKTYTNPAGTLTSSGDTLALPGQ